MNIGLLPVDGRPCTRSFPIKLGALGGDQILSLPSQALGLIKKPADFDNIYEWLMQKAKEVNAWILSADMLLYGGLVASRIGFETLSLLEERMKTVRELKKACPGCEIYVFSSMMRMNNSNVAVEEPDYWEKYGTQIWKLSYLSDQREQGHPELEDEVKRLEATIPREVIRDMQERRRRNFEINLKWLSYVEDGTVDRLIFPLDDTSRYGWNIAEQRSIRREVRQRGLEMKVLIYPGADEVAQSLLAYYINRIEKVQPKVFTFYSSVNGSLIHAKYEDRPIGESVKGQVFAAGGLIVDSPAEADIVLAVNTPGEVQGEIVLGIDLERVDTPARNLPEFVMQIKRHLRAHRPVAVADLAYANGADSALIPLLAREIELGKLCGFAGWNTTGNTLGTVIAHAFIKNARAKASQKLHEQFLLERFADDYLYQSLLRDKLSPHKDGPAAAGQANEELDSGRLEQHVNHLLSAMIQDFAGRHFQQYDVRINRIYLPWKRLFEVGVDLELINRNE